MDSLTADKIIAALRADGMRVTEARKAIIDVLISAESPMTMQEIFDAAENAPDFATVYRVVTLLEKQGFAHKMEAGRGQPYYELSDRHNDHLICTGCGKIFAIDHCPVPVATIEKAHNFKVESHSLVLYGKCADCG